MKTNDKHFFRMLDNIEYKYDMYISTEAWDLLDDILLYVNDYNLSFFDINIEWLEAKLLKLSGYNEFDYCPILGGE